MAGLIDVYQILLLSLIENSSKDINGLQLDLSFQKIKFASEDFPLVNIIHF